MQTYKTEKTDAPEKSDAEKALEKPAKKVEKSTTVAKPKPEGDLAKSPVEVAVKPVHTPAETSKTPVTSADGSALPKKKKKKKVLVDTNAIQTNGEARITDAPKKKKKKKVSVEPAPVASSQVAA